MSMKSKDATVQDVNKMNKIIRKAKEGSNTSKMTYRKLGDYESLKVIRFSDSSYKTVDDKVRSVEGRILFVTSGERTCPIMWKSKKIPRVCNSKKTQMYTDSKPLFESIYSTKQE